MRIVLPALALAFATTALPGAAQDDARDRLIRRHEQVLEQERQRQDQIQRDREERREEFRRDHEDLRDAIQRRATEREAEADRQRYQLPRD